MIRPATLLALALVLAAPASDARAAWQWPVVGEVITPYRNGDDPYAGGQHRGIDIAASEGTPVVAAAAGTVRFAGVAGSSGLTVSVRTGDGRVDTSYLHLASVTVAEGDVVSAGVRLGAVGKTGRRSAARAHLHFGVRDAGSRHGYRDPLGFLPPHPAPGGDVPRGAPVPVAAPVPAAPWPEPAEAPRGVPHGRRLPVPARVPRRVPVPGGLPARPPAPVAGPAQVPNPQVRPAPDLPREPVGAPRLGPAPRPAPAARPDAAGRPDPAALPERAAAPGGPDLGWALACLGLLLAAACIGGRGEAAGGAASRTAGWTTGWLPLLGRR